MVLVWTYVFDYQQAKCLQVALENKNLQNIYKHEILKYIYNMYIDHGVMCWTRLKLDRSCNN